MPPEEELNINLYKLNASDQLECSLENIHIAAEIEQDPDSPFLGEYIGYPGGPCQFVKTNEDCEPNSIFRFLELYYCTFEETFCEEGKKYTFFPVGVSKRTFN